MAKAFGGSAVGHAEARSESQGQSMSWPASVSPPLNASKSFSFIFSRLWQTICGQIRTGLFVAVTIIGDLFDCAGSRERHRREVFPLGIGCVGGI